MRSLAVLLLSIVSTAHAGEGPAYADPAAVNRAQLGQWIFCRLGVKADAVPGSTNMIVYTSIMPYDSVNVVDYAAEFTAHVQAAYGVQGRAQCTVSTTEAQAQQSLDYLTTNKANPSQMKVVKTGWTHQAPAG